MKIPGIWDFLKVPINGRNQTICTKTFSDRNIHKLGSLIENEKPKFTKEMFSLHGKNHQREPLCISPFSSTKIHLFFEFKSIALNLSYFSLSKFLYIMFINTSCYNVIIIKLFNNCNLNLSSVISAASTCVAITKRQSLAVASYIHENVIPSLIKLQSLCFFWASSKQSHFSRRPKRGICSPFTT